MDEGLGSGTATPAEMVSAWLLLAKSSAASAVEPMAVEMFGRPAELSLADVSFFALDTLPDHAGGAWLSLSASGRRLEAAIAIVRQAASAGAERAAFFWPPAQLWSRFDRDFVAPTMAAIDGQGMPPVMHLVAFNMSGDAGAVTVTTRGLAFFAGAELRLSGPSPLSARDALRTAARLAVDGMLQRGPAGPMIVDGLNMGERLRLGAPIVEDGNRVIPVEWIASGL